MLSLNSARCAGTFEITTYDSLDSSLGQAHDSLYLASKTWAAWHGLRLLFERGNLPDLARTAGHSAGQLEQTLLDWYDPALGFLPRAAPRLLECGPVRGRRAELSALLGQHELLDRAGPHTAFLGRLREHLRAVLQPGLCLFPDGGWKLSSTSDNSWPSKLFICQHVAERVFGLRPESGSHAVHRLLAAARAAPIGP